MEDDEDNAEALDAEQNHDDMDTSVFHNSTFLDIELACNLFPSRFWF